MCPKCKFLVPEGYRVYTVWMHPRFFSLIAFLILATVFLPSLKALDNGSIPVSARPQWTQPVTCDPAATIDPSLVDYGYYYLLVDQQIHVEQKQDYRHYAFRVINNAGLTDASQIELSWEPSYEQFTLHSLSVWRNGTKHEWTNRIRWKEIQKEESLDILQYKETRTMLLVLEDIRVNDVVEYEFSITGTNPIFGDMTAGSFHHGYNYPMDTVHFRLLVDPRRPLSIKQHVRELPVSKVTTADGLHEYVWHEKNSPEVKAEERTPPWFWTYPWIEYSQWQSWEEVREWGTKLFALSASGDAATGLAELSERIAKDRGTGQGREERLIDLLRFVQNDIRYFGIEIGINSHKPRKPLEVAASRFGDCKDKALLFSELARLDGWDVVATLVHSDAGRSINDRLPSPYAFNHVIVKLTDQNGYRYWYDPTISHQGGDLRSTHVPHYGWVLSLGERPYAEGSLEYMLDELPGTIETHETFTGTGPDGSGTLEVTTVYSGKEANAMRWRLASTGRATMEKLYLDFYQRLFPGTEKTADVRSTDDPGKNVIEVYESYSIPQLWKKSTDEKTETLYVYPHTFSTYMDAFDKLPAERKFPLFLEKPYTVTHRVTIVSPLPLLVGNESHRTDNPWYALSYDAKKEDRTVTIQWEYRNLAETIAPEVFADFRKTVKKDNEDWAGYTATTGTVYDRTGGVAWPSIPFWAFILSNIAIAFSAYFMGAEFGKK